MNCAYCEKPLICDACQEPVVPTDPEVYQALSTPDQPLNCPNCEKPLVCHWCKTPYDGSAEDEDRE